MTLQPLSDARTPWQLTESVAILETPGIRARIVPSEPHLGATLDSTWPWSSTGRESPVPSATERPPGRLFRLELPWGMDTEPVAEAYVRQQDLVITYRPQPPRTVSPQIYWRALMQQRVDCLSADYEGADYEGIEFVLSMQTDQLASSPECLLTSEFAGRNEVLRAPPVDTRGSQWLVLSEPSGGEQLLEEMFTPQGGRPCVLVRPEASEWSYLEMLYPGDFTECRLGQGLAAGGARIHWRLFAESLEKGVIRRARLRGLFLSRKDDVETAELLWREFLTSELPLST